MTKILAFALSLLVALPAAAQEEEVDLVDGLIILPASEVTLDDFLWLNRVVVVFANTDRDPAFRKQIELLNVRPEDLAMREVVVLFDTDPDELSDARRKLRPRGFSLVLVDLDGRVILRKPAPWSVRELVRSIDKSTLRRDEINSATQ